MTDLWLRAETRDDESRTPLVPADAARLLADGHRITVERSGARVFGAEEYAAAGCTVVAAGRWVDAPADACVLGLKELPPAPAQLRHRHIYFGHAFKGQPGADELLGRFRSGGGELLDLEYLTDDDGRRLAAFGYWAGYAGTALSVLHLRGRRLPRPPVTLAELDAALAAPGPSPSVLVIGALGRCGRGARAAATAAGLTTTDWDLPETRDLDRPALLAHELLVNTVLVTEPVPPFVQRADLDAPGRALRLICDVSCDVGSDLHPLPVVDRLTTWQEPVRLCDDVSPPVGVVAIDNLPTLLPREASEAFSAELVDHLRDLTTSPWRRAAERFRTTGGLC